MRASDALQLVRHAGHEVHDRPDRIATFFDGDIPYHTLQHPEGHDPVVDAVTRYEGAREDVALHAIKGLDVVRDAGQLAESDLLTDQGSVKFGKVGAQEDRVPLEAHAGHFDLQRCGLGRQSLAIRRPLQAALQSLALLVAQPTRAFDGPARGVAGQLVDAGLLLRCQRRHGGGHRRLRKTGSPAKHKKRNGANAPLASSQH